IFFYGFLFVVLTIVLVVTIVYPHLSEKGRYNVYYYFAILEAVAMAFTLVGLTIELRRSGETAAGQAVQLEGQNESSGSTDIYTLLLEQHPYTFRLWRQMNEHDPNVVALPDVAIDDLAKRE